MRPGTCARRWGGGRLGGGARASGYRRCWDTVSQTSGRVWACSNTTLDPKVLQRAFPSHSVLQITGIQEQEKGKDTPFPACLLPAQHFLVECCLLPPPICPPHEGYYFLLQMSILSSERGCNSPRPTQLSVTGLDTTVASMGRDTHEAPGRVQARGRPGKSQGVDIGGFCLFSGGASGIVPTFSGDNLDVRAYTSSVSLERVEKQDKFTRTMPGSPSPEAQSTASSEDSFKPTAPMRS